MMNSQHFLNYQQRSRLKCETKSEKRSGNSRLNLKEPFDSREAKK